MSRFQLELEFIQCLANPQYLQYLSQNNYFDNQKFLDYLKYLKYWKQPKYAKYIIYPYCLELIDLLDHKSFRDAVASAETAMFIHHKEFYHWQWFRKQKGLGLEENVGGEVDGMELVDDEDESMGKLMDRLLKTKQTVVEETK